MDYSTGIWGISLLNTYVEYLVLENFIQLFKAIALEYQSILPIEQNK